MKSKNEETNIHELIDTENRLVVARGVGWGVGEMGEGGQKVQTSSYKISHGDVMYSNGDYS